MFSEAQSAHPAPPGQQAPSPLWGTPLTCGEREAQRPRGLPASRWWSGHKGLQEHRPHRKSIPSKSCDSPMVPPRGQLFPVWGSRGYSFPRHHWSCGPPIPAARPAFLSCLLPAGAVQPLLPGGQGVGDTRSRLGEAGLDLPAAGYCRAGRARWLDPGNLIDPSPAGTASGHSSPTSTPATPSRSWDFLAP